MWLSSLAASLCRTRLSGRRVQPELHWLRFSCVTASFRASKSIPARKVSRAGQGNASRKVLMVCATVSKSIGKSVPASLNGVTLSILTKGCPPQHAFEPTPPRLYGKLHVWDQLFV